MPQISKRGIDMPASPIRKLVPYAEAAKSRGVKVYHLNIGQPDIETPPVMMDAVRNSHIRVLEYTHSAGNETYRRKLANYYKSQDIDVAYNQIIVTTGGSEGILFGLMACLDPGDEVIIPEPFYANYSSFALMAGVTVVPVSSAIETGFALPPVAEIESAVTEKTRAIVICNPNNPTGYVYSRDEMEQIKELLLRHDLYLFSDEAYRDFSYSGAVTSAMHLEGLDENVVMIDTISKRYSACGARLGALVTRNPEILNAVLKFAQARLSPPGFAQIAAEAALDLPSDYFDTTKEEYKLRRNTLVERLNQMPGVFCPMPEGAFYAIARLPVDNSDAFCQWLLESFQYNNQTVMLAPASGFYNSSGMGTNEVRLAYVLNAESINAAMDCLQNALMNYPGRTE